MHTHHDTMHKIQTGELWLTYLLYTLFFTAPVAILLSLIKAVQYRYQLKQGDPPNTRELQRLIDHYDWLNRTVLVTLLLIMMALGTLYYVVGYFFAVAALVWWVYRIGHGVITLMDDRSPLVTTAT